MYLFFDTETTGFPPKARMTQLAWQLFDADGNFIKQHQSLIKPDGWEVPNKDYWLRKGLSEEEAIKKGKFFDDNNISTERCEAEGIPVFDMLRTFQDALKQSKFKIAHNLRFDNQIVLNELKLAGIIHELFQFKKGFCTMLEAHKVGISGNHAGKGKWPKLEELHQYCFGCNFENAHDAMADVKAMSASFFELKRRGLITI